MSAVTPGDGLVHALLLDGEGGARELGWDGVREHEASQGTLWVHLEANHPGAQAWLREESGIDEVVCEALLAQDTRPRSAAVGDGLQVLLRGVNLNEGAEPEDMISVRLWLTPGRIVTTRLRRLRSVDDLREALAAGEGPRSGSDLLASLGQRLVERMREVIDAIEAAVDELEEAVITEQGGRLRSRLAAARRQAVALRRYLAPQRDAVARLATEASPLLDDHDRLRLRETADATTRYVEDLDLARERAAVVYEELAGRLSEQMNGRMYVLSIVAALFLPLGFLTGLLGVNVGGIPGAESPWGFAIVCGLMLMLVGVQVWLLRRRHWM